MSGNTLVFDLESNGLLNDVTKIHCLVIHEQETGDTIAYNDEGNAEPITRGVQRLEDAVWGTMSSVTTSPVYVRFTRGSHQPPWL